MGKLLKTITNFFSYQHYRQTLVENYLGKASDLAELERRQQELARKGIY
jgi:hypothetical protein|tara:strand:+ start:2321 stop:2467 length:147 start_codon:yes stop_codon:yes gene_type:complete